MYIFFLPRVLVLLRAEVLHAADFEERLRPVPEEVLGHDARTSWRRGLEVGEPRVGEIVEMQFRFKPTNSFGWWRGQVKQVPRQAHISPHRTTRVDHGNASSW